MISANRAARQRDNLQSHMVKTSAFQSPKVLKVKYFSCLTRLNLLLWLKKNQPLSN